MGIFTFGVIFIKMLVPIRIFRTNVVGTVTTLITCNIFTTY